MEPTDGPVLVTVSYTVRPSALPSFEAAMRPLAGSRRRTGGYRWRLYRSGEDQDVMLESFMVPSWGEHRRQQTQRLTGRDREIRSAVLEFCAGAPIERHYFPA
ncbi:MAG: MFS transporter [Nakamurella sp.]